jgi:hypothetical protein
MKLIITLLIAAAVLTLGACQSAPHHNSFVEETHRSYNPETGSFEQSPPFGKQSNKDTSTQ